MLAETRNAGVPAALRRKLWQNTSAHHPSQLSHTELLGCGSQGCAPPLACCSSCRTSKASCSLYSHSRVGTTCWDLPSPKVCVPSTGPPQDKHTLDQMTWPARCNN